MSDAEITKLSKDMQKGFADIDKKFESVDKKISNLDVNLSKRFNVVDERLDVLDKRFDAVDERLDVADIRTNKIDEQLDRLTKIVIKGFGHIDKVLETKANATDIQRIFKVLDDLSQRLEITEDERLVMATQLTRLHGWVEKAAKRIDLKFVR